MRRVWSRSSFYCLCYWKLGHEFLANSGSHIFHMQKGTGCLLMIRFVHSKRGGIQKSLFSIFVNSNSLVYSCLSLHSANTIVVAAGAASPSVVIRWSSEIVWQNGRGRGVIPPFPTFKTKSIYIYISDSLFPSILRAHVYDASNGMIPIRGSRPISEDRYSDA